MRGAQTGYFIPGRDGMGLEVAGNSSAASQRGMCFSGSIFVSNVHGSCQHGAVGVAGESASGTSRWLMEVTGYGGGASKGNGCDRHGWKQ